MKHTKGPWIYEESTKTIRSIPENYWLTTMDSWDGAINNNANARLIASAPNLLEACKGLISNAVWDGKTREHGSANEYTVHRAVIEATQRAIMKAEGRDEG